MKTEWTIKDATKYYGLDSWGRDYFSIDAEGFICVHPQGDQRTIRIHEILMEALEKGIQPPLTIRIQDLLQTRVKQLNKIFNHSIKNENYAGRYRGVFPIKVNQLREVVEEIRDAGRDDHFGLECGSKPELMIALAMHKDPKSLIICNGYKDDAFIYQALYGRKLGKEIYLVVEQLSEIPKIIRISQQLKIEPLIGLRIKLSTHGEGKWASSGGEDAKFGLTSTELLHAAESISAAGLQQSLKLIHFHIGSQVPNIQTIKKATIEACRYYCELAHLGFPMSLIDVGGGLGIDYDGSCTNYESSMNYSVREYAREIVSNIRTTCESAQITVPDIISESGRSIVAPHSILITEVCDRISKCSVKPKVESPPNCHNLVQELQDVLLNVNHQKDLERFHQAQQKKEAVHQLFDLGYLNLQERAQADAIYWEICQQIVAQTHSGAYLPPELEDLPSMMAEQYVCNFSVFQSLIDHWACNQLFPVAPIHRLNARPTVTATLVDITCDSEGKISEFTNAADIRRTLQLHPLEASCPYYLGFFLVGAYQDIMGDLHNLFGRVHEVHVFLEDDEENGFYIEEHIHGFTTNDVLDLTQYSGHLLIRQMKKQIDHATREDRIKPREGTRMLDQFAKLIKSYTYLDSDCN
ncbi:MAG: biosynthetic arginine decarboxylase [Opitutales bacterium]